MKDGFVKFFFPSAKLGSIFQQRVVFPAKLSYNETSISEEGRCVGMVSKIYSMGLYGMEAFPVEVEADLSQGLPAFELVGLPDAAVKESRDRVRSALKNCGFDFPVSRITMNLAPADKKKEGPIYDLPLLVSLLKASRQLSCHTEDAVFLGELSLSGELRPIRGVLPMADKAGRRGLSGCLSRRKTPGRARLFRGWRCMAFGISPSCLPICGACWSSLRPCPSMGTPPSQSPWILPM